MSDRIKGLTSDPEKGRMLAEDGISRSSEHIERIDPMWRESALDCIQMTAVRLATFTTDDVHDQLKARGIDTEEMPLPRSYGSALGGLMQAAKKAGYIAPTRELRRSLRPTTHGSIDRIVWKSLLHESAAPQEAADGRS